MTVTDRQALAGALSAEQAEDLRQQLRGALILPGDPDYDTARAVWNGLIDKRPAAIARCAGTADVVAAIRFASANGIEIAVRGGGHNVAGHATSDGGLVIDLSMMRAVQVDPQRRVARVQGGALWGDLDREAQLHGLVTPGGEVSTTGIAGYTLSGGIGLLHRKWGLACDNLLGVEIVTADGAVRRASQTEHPDLFWAIRGGGGNFGVVTWFEYQLHPLGPEVYSVAVLYQIEQAARILREWRAFTAQAPDEVTAEAFVWCVPPFPDLPDELAGAPALIIGGLYAGPADEGEQALRPLREFGEPLLDLSGPAPYVEVQSAFDALFPAGLRCYWKSLFIEDLSDALLDVMLEQGSRRPSAQSLLALRHLGGAISRIPEDATAFGNRGARYNLSVDAIWEDPADDERSIRWARATWEALRAHTGGGVYLNFAGLGEDTAALTRAGHRGNYERLRALKAKYDPDNLFRGNINIAPLSQEEAS